MPPSAPAYIDDIPDKLIDPIHRVAPFELLEVRNVQSDDPEAIVYFRAKKMYQKGYDICLTLPRDLSEGTLANYENQIRESSKLLVDAWLLDDRAAPLTERILILAQQYEIVILKSIPSDPTGSHTDKYGLLFSIWILVVGRNYKFSLRAIEDAISKYEDLPARIHYLRAASHFGLNDEANIKNGIDDLMEAIQCDPTYSAAYFALGSVYAALGDHIDEAIENYKLCLKHGYSVSLDTIQSLYGLAVLYDKKSQWKTALDYYKLAMSREEEFTKMYGTHTGLSSLKRTAIDLYEKPADANILIAKCTPKRKYDKKIKELVESGQIQLSYPPNEHQCSACGLHSDKLMVCGGCAKIWYCSRDCQAADYRRTHREKCSLMKQQLW